MEDVAIDVSRLQQRIDELNLDELQPALNGRCNLAPYVPRSKSLLALARMGVELGKLEKSPGIGNLLLRTDYEEDIVPLLNILHNFGITQSRDLATIINQFPRFIQFSSFELEQCLDNLSTLPFNRHELVQLIVKNPKIFSKSPTRLSRQMETLQKSFALQIDHVKEMILSEPALLTFPSTHFTFMQVALLRSMGFLLSEAQSMVKSHPLILMTDRNVINGNYAFLHRVMNLEPEVIYCFPKALADTSGCLRPRILYLKSLSLLELDPTKPLFVSLDDLVSLSAEKWCSRLAPGVASVEQFNLFIKTL